MLLGYDIGASNSGVAFFDGRSARMIEMGEGINTILPSVVTVVDGGNGCVGQDAIEMGKKHPEGCFRLFKRQLAEPWQENEDTGYHTCRGPDGLTHYQAPDGSTYSPIELTSYIIEALTNAAKARLREPVTGGVFCVPADFSQAKRQAHLEAARLGLERAGVTNPRIDLMHEPTAAALAYGFDVKKTRRIVVVDLGGSTLDISVIQTGGGLVDVLTTNGIIDLGGADWDRRIAEYTANLWQQEHETDLRARDAAMARIMIEAEAAKRRLSEKTETLFRVDDIDRTKEGVALHMIYTLDRKTLDDLTKDLRDRILGACKAAMADLKRQDANFSIRDIHDVLLVGGMTRVPAIRALIHQFFGQEPKRDQSPETVVAEGAAIRAAIVEGRKKDTSIHDILSRAICIETMDNVSAILIPKNTGYPFDETFNVSNAYADQKQASIRLLEGNAGQANLNALLASYEQPIDPGEAESADVKLRVYTDKAGLMKAEVNGTEIFST